MAQLTGIEELQYCTKTSVSQLEISDTALILISPPAHKMLTTSTAAPNFYAPPNCSQLLPTAPKMLTTSRAAPNFYAPQLQTPDISSTA